MYTVWAGLRSDDLARGAGGYEYMTAWLPYLVTFICARLALLSTLMKRTRQDLHVSSSLRSSISLSCR